MKNMEKFVMQIAHDILCASSESGSHVEQVMPEGIIKGFADFDESYDSDTLQNVVDWLFKEAVETVGDKLCKDEVGKRKKPLRDHRRAYG